MEVRNGWYSRSTFCTWKTATADEHLSTFVQRSNTPSRRLDRAGVHFLFQNTGRLISDVALGRGSRLRIVSKSEHGFLSRHVGKKTYGCELMIDVSPFDKTLSRMGLRQYDLRPLAFDTK